MSGELPLITEETPLRRSSSVSGPRISNVRRIAYAFGSVPKSSMNIIISVYFTPFLLEVASLPPAYASGVIFGERVLDACSDLLIGFGLAKFSSRFGKYRPWLLLSMPVMGSLFVLLWYVPEVGSTYKALYYVCVYWLWAMSQTCFNVPYASMTLASTSCQRERDTLTAVRMASEFLGSIVGLLIHAIILLTSGALGSADCDAYYTTESELQHQLQQLLEAKKRAYMNAAVVITVIVLISGLIAFWSLKEVYDLHSEDMTFKELLRNCGNMVRFRPFVYIAVVFLLCSVAVTIATGNYQLYFTYAIKNQVIFPFYVLLIFLMAFLGMPLWNRFVFPKFGKKTASAISAIPLMILLWLHLFLKYNPVIIILMGMLVGLSLGGIYLVPQSVTPDVISAYTLEHGHGKESLFYAITGFFDKLGIGFALAASTLVLDAVGYQNANPCVPQNARVEDALRVLISVVPIACLMAIMLMMWMYPINEQSRRAMRSRIRQSMSALSRGRYGVSAPANMAQAVAQDVKEEPRSSQSEQSTDYVFY